MQHPLLVKPDPHPVVLIRNKVKRHLDQKGELLMASVLINVSYSFDPVPVPLHWLLRKEPVVAPGNDVDIYYIFHGILNHILLTSKQSQKRMGTTVGET